MMIKMRRYVSHLINHKWILSILCRDVKLKLPVFIIKTLKVLGKHHSSSISFLINNKKLWRDQIYPIYKIIKMKFQNTIILKELSIKPFSWLIYLLMNYKVIVKARPNNVVKIVIFTILQQVLLNQGSILQTK